MARGPAHLHRTVDVYRSRHPRSWLQQDTWQSLSIAVDGARLVRWWDASSALTIDGTAGTTLQSGRMPAAGVTRALAFLGRSGGRRDGCFKGLPQEVRLWSPR